MVYIHDMIFYDIFMKYIWHMRNKIQESQSKSMA